jgi:effector-binding domain-containing protein
MSYEPRIETREARSTAVVHTTVPMSGIGEALSSIFSEVVGYLGRVGAMPLEAFARYTIHDGGTEVDIEAGFSTTGSIRPEGRIETGSLPGGEVATVLHVGPYDRVGEAYEAVEAWLEKTGREQREQPWEVYLSMPEEVPPRTLVIFPLRPAVSRPQD